MQVILILVLATLGATADLLAEDNGTLDRAKNNLMQNTGYPKPGDIPVLNRKVFKGQRVHIREHPYVASIRRRTSHYLTAALLTRNMLVTVAHPLIDVPVTELNVVLGENYSDRGATMFTVLLVIIHENFDRFTLKNDIAMLRLYEDISYKGNIKSISLTPPHASLARGKAFVTGWGRCDNMGMELCLDRSSKYYPDEKMDPMLRSVTFIMKSPNYYCDGYKRHEVPIHPGMLCTGGAREDDPVCPCIGVPGALLVTNARLAGILSWGFGCGYSYDLPLIYTDIRFFSRWIANNIKVSRLIKSENLSALFEATKAAILSQWLIETRVTTPKLVIRTDKTLEPLDLDYELVKLHGTVYDVRDFISDGLFHSEKRSLYNTLREQITKVQPLMYSPKRVPAAPFLREETLQEIGLNKNDVIGTFTATTTNGSATDSSEVVKDDDED